jgi:fumarylacetoacetase
MAQRRTAWIGVRRQLIGWLTDAANAARASDAPTPQGGATLHLPFEVADYVDFYSSQHDAESLGAMFRPGSAALMPNRKPLPVGYHGPAGPCGCPEHFGFGTTGSPDVHAVRRGPD